MRHNPVTSILPKLRPSDLSSHMENPDGVAEFVKQNWVYRTPPSGKADGYNDQLVYVPTGDVVSERHVKQFLRHKGVLSDTIKGAWDRAKFDLVYINGERFEPNERRLFESKGAHYLNTWTKPEIGFSKTEVTERPDLLDQLYTRWWPDHPEYRDTLDEYLALTVCRPNWNLDCTPVLRSLHGTGKNMLFDRVVRPLCGKANATNVKYSKLKGRFNGEYFETTCLLVDEFSAQKRSEADDAKTMVSDRSRWLEKKYQQPYYSDIYTNMIFTSNLEAPLAIEQNERRYWFPAFITFPSNPTTVEEVNKAQVELSNWVDNEFLPYLNGGRSKNAGLQEIRDWWEHLSRSLSETHFRQAPVTPELLELKERYSQRDTISELHEFLNERRSTFKFTPKTLSERFRLDKAVIEKALNDCQYISSKTASDDVGEDEKPLRRYFWQHRSQDNASSLLVWTSQRDYAFQRDYTPNGIDTSNPDWADTVVTDLWHHSQNDRNIRELVKKRFNLSD